VIVHRVHVRRFRKLADQRLDCGPGLNVIRGPNDAGKSTLHEAFSAALFQMKPSETLPWGEDRPGEITMEFEADGQHYRLHKDFSSRKVLLTSGDRSWEAPKSVETEIGRILGLTSLSLFRATAHIGQWDLAAVKEEKAEIGAQLSRIVTGGDSDAGRILRELDERLRQMEVGLRHPSKRPGPLKQQGDLIARLTETRGRLEQEVAAIEQAAADRDRLAARIAEVQGRLATDGALLEANRRLYELDRKSDELGRRAAELQSLEERIDGAMRAVDTAGGDEALAFPAVEPGALVALRETAMRLEVLERHVDVHEAPETGIAGTSEDSETAAARRGAPGLWLKRRTQFLWTAMLAGATAAGSLAWMLVRVIRYQAPAGEAGLFLLITLLAGAIGALAAIAASMARGQSLAEAATAARVRERAQARQDAAARRADLEVIRQELARQLQVLGVATAQEAIDRQERRERALRQLDACRHLLETLLGGRSRESVAQERQRVLLELAAVQAQRDHPDLALKRLDPPAFQRLQAEVERSNQDLADARAQLQRLEGRLGERSPYEELARVEEELAGSRDRLTRLERQVQVLRLTHEVLQDAYRHTIVPGKDRLEQLASEYLRALSGGVYTRIQVDADSLTPKVWVGAPKPDGWASVEGREIGSGAVDQCYLALRLGLVAVLCGDRWPPLFLDDPFLAYDEERQASAMRLIQGLARERQIFLFTCRSVYDAHADRVLVLGSAPVPT
jgi:uncharacterized protein YhaN